MLVNVLIKSHHQLQHNLPTLTARTIMSKDKAVINKDPELERVFRKLSTIEDQLQQVDIDVNRYKIKQTEPIYKTRRELLSKIPNFWYIVLAQHEDFQEFIRTEDMKYLEYIKEIHVERMVDANGPNDDPNTFKLTVKFESPQPSPSSHNKPEIDTQEIVKYFKTITDPESGANTITATKATVKWPSEFNKINPTLIKQAAKSQNRKLTPIEKKHYRIGMKSFFAFFEWTGLKDGKEFRNGEDLAELISECIFPLALDLYTLAVPGIGRDGEEDEAGSSSEELDLSDDDGDDDDSDDEQQPPTKKAKKN